MKTADHLLLANRLIAKCAATLPADAAAGLRIGSVLPDCNPFTYLCETHDGFGVHGHNAEATRHRISTLLARTENGGARDFLYGLRLGTALHYIADAFTYPHHAYFPGTLADHVRYEEHLHTVFARHNEQLQELPCVKISEFPAFLDTALDIYRTKRKNELDDCRFINSMCAAALKAALVTTEKEIVFHENTDYDRPVSAVR